jgi:hypothetical protein
MSTHAALVLLATTVTTHMPATTIAPPEDLGAANRGRAPFDTGWKFIRAESPAASPPPPAVSLNSATVCENITLMPGLVTMHLTPVPGATSLAACKQACCAEPSCETAQWCGPAGCGDPPTDQSTCWMGLLTNTKKGPGWSSWDMGRGHSPPPPPGPRPHPSPTPSPAHRPINPAFSLPSFDDSGWTDVETPHDWMIHDLPSREDDTVTPVLGPRYGIWKFSKWNAANGSDANWSDPAFDDSGWQSVKGGADWRVASGYNVSNAVGWYRQTVTVPDHFLNASNLLLSLGVIAGCDQAWVNGVSVGQTDKYPPAVQTYELFRKYPLAVGGGTGGSPCTCAKPRQPCKEPGRTFCPSSKAPGQCDAPCTNSTPGAAPKMVLKKGENFIAIRVHSQGGSRPGGL